MGIRTATENIYPNQLNKLKSQPIFSEPSETEWCQQFRYLFLRIKVLKLKQEKKSHTNRNRQSTKKSS